MSPVDVCSLFRPATVRPRVPVGLLLWWCVLPKVPSERLMRRRSGQEGKVGECRSRFVSFRRGAQEVETAAIGRNNHFVARRWFGCGTMIGGGVPAPLLSGLRPNNAAEMHSSPAERTRNVIVRERQEGPYVGEGAAAYRII